MGRGTGQHANATAAARPHTHPGLRFARRLAVSADRLWEIDCRCDRLRDLYSALAKDEHALREAEQTLRDHDRELAAANLTAMRLLNTADPDPRIEQIAHDLYTAIHPDDRRLLTEGISPSTGSELRRRFIRQAFSAVGGISVPHAQLASAALAAARDRQRPLTDTEETQLLQQTAADAPVVSDDELHFRITCRVSRLLNVWLDDEDGPQSTIAAVARAARSEAVRQLNAHGFHEGADRVAEMQEVPTATLLKRMLMSPGRPMLADAITDAFFDVGHEHEHELRRAGW